MIAINLRPGRHRDRLGHAEDDQLSLRFRDLYGAGAGRRLDIINEGIRHDPYDGRGLVAYLSRALDGSVGNRIRREGGSSASCLGPVSSCRICAASCR